MHTTVPRFSANKFLILDRGIRKTMIVKIIVIKKLTFQLSNNSGYSGEWLFIA